jgi:hypothetical protein
MAWPTLSIAIDFTNGPLTALASNSWTDITSYVISFSTRRGRADALGRMEAGSATVVLDNSDRSFAPLYAGSAFYPNIVPMKKIRIRATYSAVVYDLFVGHVTNWPPDWPGGLDATTTIQCVDAFTFFASVKLNGAYANEFCNWSIDTWLTNIGWPAADRTLASASSQIQSGTFVNTQALQHFQNVADVESGLFFMGADGKATFQDRYYRQTNSLTSDATFDDDPSAALPWLKAASAYDDTQIWNEARVTRTGGTEQVATDATSQAQYFTRTLTRTLPMLSDTEALSLAQYLVGVYANPIFRYTSLVLDGNMADALWPHMLGRAISDRITVQQRPPPLLPTPFLITADCYIEAIAHEVTATEDGTYWQTTFGLSSADALAGSSFWVLDSTTYSVLDSTTKLGY